jgi:hypothetical protein
MQPVTSQHNVSTDITWLSQIITASFASVSIFVLLSSIGFLTMDYVPFGLSAAIVGSYGGFFACFQTLAAGCTSDRIAPDNG